MIEFNKKFLKLNKQPVEDFEITERSFNPLVKVVVPLLIKIHVPLTHSGEA